jgi:hypothetical protein
LKGSELWEGKKSVQSIAKSVRSARLNAEARLLSSEHAETMRPDQLHRFTPTPHTADVRLMQRTVRFETNSSAVLQLVLKCFERHQHGPAGAPQFVWCVVSEADPTVQATAVQFTAFSEPGFRYVNIGQRGFLAVDLERCEATGYFANLFLEGEPRLRHCRSLDLLFTLTAPSLGLTALSGGCVGDGDRGAMIFGPPNSGKTTACYLAARLGMEFHADQVVFLDTSRNLLRAWGDLLPAVFRPEALEFLPELRGVVRRSSYADLAFCYLDKTPLQARLAQPVTPVCSIFLDRGTTGEPQLTEMTREDAVSRLRECLLFHEDARFDAQITDALTELAGRPVYKLQYGSDPAVAASYIEGLLR